METMIKALPKGTAFSRVLWCLGKARGDIMGAVALAEPLIDTPAVRMVLRAAIEAQSIDNSDELAQFAVNLDFVEAERGVSILGRLLPFMRRVPFRSSTIRETIPGSCDWVPESGLKPATVLSLDTLKLPEYRLATIFAVTTELFRFSRPQIETILRRSGPLTVAAQMDNQMLDPAVGLVAGVHPASLTNGATPFVTTGVALANVQADLQGMAALLNSWRAPRWVLNPATAAYIAGLSAAVFPELRATPDGGFLLGIPVICSANCPIHLVVLLDAEDVLIADDERVGIYVASQGDITLDDGTSPASTTTRSLFQENLVAMRIERYVSWLRAHDDAVIYMVTAY